jgi:hypothetical protein
MRLLAMFDRGITQNMRYPTRLRAKGVSLLIVIFIFSACSTTIDNKKIRHITTPHVSAPLILDRWAVAPFSLTQIVESEFQGKSYKVHFEVEWKDQKLTIIGLTLASVPIFIIQASKMGNEMQLFIPDNNISSMMDPEWVLSDFLLTVAPLGLLNSSLSSSTLRVTAETPLERHIMRQPKMIAQIFYSEPNKFSSEILFHNFEFEYIFSVKNIRFQEIKL